jgi:hypothetical protein
METIATEFSTHEEAQLWADNNNKVIIMSALKDGKIHLTVI